MHLITHFPVTSSRKTSLSKVTETKQEQERVKNYLRCTLLSINDGSVS